MTAANSDFTTSLHDDGPWSEPLNVRGIAVAMWSRTALLSIDLRGWEHWPDDLCVGWVADNGPTVPEPVSATRLRLQAMIDGPMVGNGIGRPRGDRSCRK